MLLVIFIDFYIILQRITKQTSKIYFTLIVLNTGLVFAYTFLGKWYKYGILVRSVFCLHVPFELEMVLSFH
jgi:hypothetical protein